MDRIDTSDISELREDEIRNAKLGRLFILSRENRDNIEKLGINWRERLNSYIEKGLENNLI